MTLLLTFDQSGRSKNSMPAAAPGSKMEQMVSTSVIMNRVGIMIFEKRSMPDCTPLVIIKCVIPMKRMNQSEGSQGLAVNFSKMLANSVAGTSAKALDRESQV